MKKNSNQNPYPLSASPSFFDLIDKKKRYNFSFCRKDSLLMNEKTRIKRLKQLSNLNQDYHYSKLWQYRNRKYISSQKVKQYILKKFYPISGSIDLFDYMDYQRKGINSFYRFDKFRYPISGSDELFEYMIPIGGAIHSFYRGYKSKKTDYNSKI